MADLKIIYLHQYFNTPEMAGGTRSYEMARRLVSMGHEVHMITSWRGHSKCKEWTSSEDGINVHWASVRYANSFSDGQRILAFIKFLFLAIRKGLSLKGDIVFATSTPLTIAIPGYIISKKLSIPMVFEVRDLWPELPIAIGAIRNPFLCWLANMLEKFAYFNSKMIVALSDGMKEGIVAKGYNSNSVSVIPNSCDLDFFEVNDSIVGQRFRIENKIPEHVKLFVYAGTFGRINGVSYMVELAAALSNQRDIYFLAVGEGAEHEKITQLAQDRGVLNINFKVVDSVSKAEMVDVLAAADVALSLFISLKEMEANSANKFFDALAASIPVLINYGGWQSKLLKDNDAGLQLDRNIKIAANQIRALVSDPEKLKKMGLNARRLGESKFSRDFLAKKLEDVLKQAINAS